jgi:hypothetical protein
MVAGGVEMRRAGSIARGLTLALLLFGCSVNTGPVPATVILGTESTGTLVVSWTIGLNASPDACTHATVTAVSIHLATTGGADVGTYSQDCTAFSTSIRLPPETYQGSAVLLDAAGRARTSSVHVQSFTILGGDVITTPIDFSIATFTPD